MWEQSVPPAVYLGVVLFLIIAGLVIEIIRHRASLFKIPIRIHVNGTRGKSSVARLIAAGLRAGGIRTSAKTTGTLARFIYPDGHEEGIYRMGHTNIAEQIDIVRKAQKLNSEALVIECMSLQPLLQSVCELKLVRSTHGVLTNARPDHLDVMGPLESDVALALAGTVPIRGKYFTAEENQIEILKKAVADRKSKLFQVAEKEINEITDEEISKFSYEEFKENVALALSVCTSLNIDREVALKGMWSATPDPGAMSIYTVEFEGHQIIFANGFAANDPVSTEKLWLGLLNRFPECEDTMIIMNCRSDRHDRSAILGKAITSWKLPKRLLSIGSGVKTFIYEYNKNRKAKKHNLSVINGEGWDVNEILNCIVDSDVKVHLVVGIGNIADIGLRLVSYFQEHRE